MDCLDLLVRNTPAGEHMTHLVIHFYIVPRIQDSQLWDRLQYARGLRVLKFTTEVEVADRIALKGSAEILALVGELDHIREITIERDRSLLDETEHPRRLELAAMLELRNKTWAATDPGSQ